MGTGTYGREHGYDCALGMAFIINQSRLENVQ